MIQYVQQKNRHFVYLPIALQGSGHHVSYGLVFTIPREAYRFSVLLGINTRYGIDQSTHDIIDQRDIPVALYVVLLSNDPSLVCDGVTPLVAIDVS